MNKIIAAAVASFFAISIPLSSTVNAQSMHTLQALADAEPNAVPYAGQVMWFARHWTEYGVVSYSSAVRINKYWGITAAHAVESTGTPPDMFTVGTGPNWMTDPGETREIVEWKTYPGWVGVWDGVAVDLAVIRWEEPLEGEDLDIGTLNLGDMLEYVGYAKPATPATGMLPADGKRRMFEAKVNGWGMDSGQVSTDYSMSLFSAAGGNYLPMGGVGTAGGSGSPGFGQDGKLVAMLVAQSSSPGYGGASFGLRLDLYADWIEEQTYIAPPADPPHHTPYAACLINNRYWHQMHGGAAHTTLAKIRRRCLSSAVANHYAAH